MLAQRPRQRRDRLSFVGEEDERRHARVAASGRVAGSSRTTRSRQPLGVRGQLGPAVDEQRDVDAGAAERQGGVHGSHRQTARSARRTGRSQLSSRSTGSMSDKRPASKRRRSIGQDAGAARRVHPFFRDIGSHAAGSGGVRPLSLLLYRLLAENAGTDGFASYSLVKQGVSFIFPIVTVGLSEACRGTCALPAEDAALAGGLPAGGRRASAAAPPGRRGAAPGRPPAPPPSSSSAARPGRARADPSPRCWRPRPSFQLAYGYCRGSMRVRAASLLQVGAFALPPPLIVLAFSDESIATLIPAWRLALAVLSLLAIAATARALAHRRTAAVHAAGRSALWDYGYRPGSGRGRPARPVRAGPHPRRPRGLAD